MDKLRVAFLDFWPEIKDENIFLSILQKYFNVEITTSNPTVVIHSIFGGMKNTPNYKCKKILFIGENYRANQYKSDYSVSFDSHSDTNYHLPLWQFYLILRPELKEKLFNRSNNHTSFDRFCSFTVSNPSNFYRNGFYDQLNAYKRVHSYGRSLTNDFGLQRTSQGKYWRNAKYDFFLEHKHKFAITFEHSSYPGYVTEKLMDAFLGGSLPIYWGSSTIHKEFNEKAFINVMKFSNKDLMEYIKYVDNNDDEFLKIYSELPFTVEQKQRHIKNIEDFEPWLLQAVNI